MSAKAWLEAKEMVISVDDSKQGFSSHHPPTETRHIPGKGMTWDIPVSSC